jgi:hypothetical protein
MKQFGKQKIEKGKRNKENRKQAGGTIPAQLQTRPSIA